MEEKCKHGMNPAWCSNCERQSQSPEVKRKQIRQPAPRKETTAFGSEAIAPEELNLAGWIVVHTNRGRDNPVYDQLDRVTHVHIQGFPFVWALERILKNAPKLRQIQVIPTMYTRLHPDSHLKRCAEHGVQVVTGHIRPDLVWVEGENRSRFYSGQRQFLLSLKEEQKALWDELLAMRFEAALMTARYFCLNGEVYISKDEIGRQFGFSVHNSATISTDLTNAVIYYLDPTFDCSPRAQQIAYYIRPKVERLRKYFEVSDYQRRFAVELGLDKLPVDLPMARYETFKALLEAQRTGRVQALVKNRRAQVLDLRFGLTSGAYLTLEGVGEQMGITRERVRQLEQEGLDILGIHEE